MNQMILIITFFSISLSGTIYLGYDMSGEVDFDYSEFNQPNISSTIDKKSITLGYNHPVFQKESIGISIGLSTSIKPFEDDGKKAKLTSLYLLPTYSFNKNLMGWLSMGYSSVSSEWGTNAADEPNIKNGPIYGFGLHYKINETVGLGLGYLISNHPVSFPSWPDPNAEAEFELSRMTLFTGYSF